MKTKKYDFDPEKHDMEKLTRAFYCGMRIGDKVRPNVAEVNNPTPAFDHVEMNGEDRFDEKMKKLIADVLGQKAADLQRRSVESIEDALDFDIDESEFEDEMRTKFEVLGGVDIQALKDDQAINHMQVDLKQETTPAQTKEPSTVPKTEQTPPAAASTPEE